jgi:hypothetical protein
MEWVRWRCAVLGAAFAVVLAGCAGNDDSADPPATSAPVSASAPAASMTSAEPSLHSPAGEPSTSPSASQSASPSVHASVTTSAPAPVPGRRMTAEGAYLQPAESEVLTKPDPENGCAAHDPDLDDVTCEVIQMPGGVVTWVAGLSSEPVPRGSEPRYVARIYQRLPIGSDALAFAAAARGGEWVGSDAKPLSMMGQAADTVLFAVTFQGSGLYSGYDLLTWPVGGNLAVAAHHGEDSHAQREFRPGRIDTFAADYSDGAPNCCPNFFTHDVVRWDPVARHFRVQVLAKVPAAQRR